MAPRLVAAGTSSSCSRSSSPSPRCGERRRPRAPRSRARRGWCSPSPPTCPTSAASRGSSPQRTCSSASQETRGGVATPDAGAPPARTAGLGRCRAWEPTSTARPLRRLVVLGKGDHGGWPPCLPCTIPAAAGMRGVLISILPGGGRLLADGFPVDGAVTAGVGLPGGGGLLADGFPVDGAVTAGVGLPGSGGLLADGFPVDGAVTAGVGLPGGSGLLADGFPVDGAVPAGVGLPGGGFSGDGGIPDGVFLGGG